MNLKQKLTILNCVYSAADCNLRYMHNYCKVTINVNIIVYAFGNVMITHYSLWSISLDQLSGT